MRLSTNQSSCGSLDVNVTYFLETLNYYTLKSFYWYITVPISGNPLHALQKCFLSTVKRDPYQKMLLQYLIDESSSKNCSITTVRTDYHQKCCFTPVEPDHRQSRELHEEFTKKTKRSNCVLGDWMKCSKAVAGRRVEMFRI